MRYLAIDYGPKRTGVAIWTDIPAEVGTFDVFVGGLSGETATVKLPVPIKASVTDVKTGKKKQIVKKEAILSKTLQIRYRIRGDASARFQHPAKFTEKKWVMR